jgi:ABC-type nitrate/sulfonate/bicarbonate transport system permease component
MSGIAGEGGGRTLVAVRDGLVYAYPLLLLLLIWEFVARAGGVRPIFLPAVSTVLAQAVVLASDGQVAGPLATSLFRAFAGLVLAAVIGVALGVAMTRNTWLRWVFDPLVAVGFPSPKITFLPIFILWFGIDHLSKILLVAFTCVFPMVVCAYHGAAAVNQTLVWSAQAMGTPERRLLWRVVFPSSLPALFSGLRVTLPVALITAFTAEMVAGGGGVGTALMFAQRFFETPTVFVYILVMLLTGFVLDRVMLAIRESAVGWHDEEARG